MASVKVAVRVRPFNKREKDLKSSLIINVEGNKTTVTNKKLSLCPGSPRDFTHVNGNVTASPFTSPRNSTYLSATLPCPNSSGFLGGTGTVCSPGFVGGSSSSLGRERLKQFTFDFSYWSVCEDDAHYASQEQIYNDLGVDVVRSAYAGYNACIFAYGQTGSGKTFTMMGSDANQGLIPRICQSLFAEMVDSEVTFRTEVSYLEIYNERVRDLLRDKSQPQLNLKVREHPKQGPYVQDLSKHLVMSYADIEALIVEGNNNRTTAATNMNDHSSRSHAVFTIVFTQATFKDDIPSEISSKVNLVDLAGSERADASGATGERLKEGGSINKSLVTLGNVISTLADMSERVVSPRRSIFIPYRDSVLTWLLKDSLGGNAKTIMIATISPADCNYAETLSTLRYANRAKKIVNKPRVNEDPNVKLIRELREENAKLKELLSANNDWFLTTKKLNRNEERMKELTIKWTDKWNETASVLEEHNMLALRKEGSSVVLDSELPHLLCIDDDILSTGMKLYHLKERDTYVGNGEAPSGADIVLTSPYIQPRHCIIHHAESGEVELVPCPEARCSVNSRRITEPTKLTQGDVIRLGRRHVFRFNHPYEAAKLRQEKNKGGATSNDEGTGSTFTWSHSSHSLTDSALGSDFDFVDEDCDFCPHEHELNRIERKRLALEKLRAQHTADCENQRLARHSADEAARASLEQKRHEAERAAEEARKAGLVAQKVQKEIGEIATHLKQSAQLYITEKEKFAHEQERLEQEKLEVEEEKQKAKEERQRIRKKREFQKAKAEIEKRRQESKWEELRLEQARLAAEKQRDEHALRVAKENLIREHETQAKLFRQESQTMRETVESEVQYIRQMAGLEPDTASGKEDPNLYNLALNENDSAQTVISDGEDNLSELELRVEDIIGREAAQPVVPQIFLQSSIDDTEESSSRFSNLDLQTDPPAPLSHQSSDYLLSRLVELGLQVKEIHQHVCTSLEERYRGGGAGANGSGDASGVTGKLEQDVIDQFKTLRPLFEQLERALQVKENENLSLEDTLRDYDHKLNTVDRFLQIHTLIQSIEQEIKEKRFIAAIASLEEAQTLMGNVDVENQLEIALQKNLRIELCLLRERLLYELNETWDDMLKWTLPVESRRLANKTRVITLDTSRVEKDLAILICVVQAMHNVEILDSRIKLFCDRLMNFIVAPLVQDKNTMIELSDTCDMCLSVSLPPQNSKKNDPVAPTLVFPKLQEVFSFLHKPLEFVFIVDGSNLEAGTKPVDSIADNMEVQKTDEHQTKPLVQKIGCYICKKLFECIYNDCLSHVLPRSVRQYELFNEVIRSAEAFQEHLTVLGFMPSYETSLLDYLNNVNTLFANIKGQEMLRKASEYMAQELTQHVGISVENPLGLPRKPCGAPHPTEVFVYECKQRMGTLNLKLPSCQISLPVRSLVCLAYETLHEAVQSSGDSAVHFCHSVHNMFELYCDVVPSYHREPLKNVPLMAALHHNNCMFVAHHLITVDKVFTEKFKEHRLTSSSGACNPECGLAPLVPKVKKLGKDSFNEHLNVRKEELCDKLIPAQGFECVADDEGIGASHAIKLMLHHLKHIANIWRDVLPANTYCRAVGCLLNTALENVTESILSIEEYSVDDCDFLQKALETIAVQAPVLFQMVDSSSNPQVLLHEYVPSYFRFKELFFILGSGLQQISDRWVDGKGPLALHFTAQEMRRLVTAMFENTSKRDLLLKQLR